jgi:hypothetical protein
MLKANAFIVPRLFHQASVFIARVFAAECEAAGKPTAYPGAIWRTEFGAKTPVWTIVGWLRELWVLWCDSGSVDDPTMDAVNTQYGFIAGQMPSANGDPAAAEARRQPESPPPTSHPPVVGPSASASRFVHV